jgi:kynurenine formamidase
MMSEIVFNAGGKTWSADLSHPIDISLPLRSQHEGVRCFHAPPVRYAPVESGNFIGSTELGGPVNHFIAELAPHGSGTHTECAGHIITSMLTISMCLRQSHFLARLISLEPRKNKEGDLVICQSHLESFIGDSKMEALIIRTLPNPISKTIKDYSGSNPPFFDCEAMKYMVRCGIRHLLIDLPSVDKEEDAGRLCCHKAFWGIDEKRYFSSLDEIFQEGIRYESTITELIFVPEEIPDGFYLLNLQTVGFELDVSPSRPILYSLSK